MSKNYEKLKEIVLNSEDLSELRTSVVEIAESIDNNYKLMSSINVSDCMTRNSRVQYSTLKGEISKLKVLVGICNDKIEFYKNEHNRTNYNFRMAAKTILTKSTYNTISELSKHPRKYVKEMKSSGVDKISE